MFKHFPSESVEKVLAEIKAEIGDYQSLVSNICRQIREYYDSLSIIDRKTKLIIGLSGGIDSTVVSYLVTRAMGYEDVVTVNMPVREDDECIERANLVARVLRTRHYVIPIGSIVDSEIENINRFRELSIDRNSEGEMDRMRVGNYASRLRVALLYDIARRLNGKVLGTSNRTEFVQGYAAKWGTPMSFDFGVLDDLYKVDVYSIAETLGVPQEIIDTIPSTGYFPGQTHEDELGATIEEQDVGAFLLFDRRMGIDEIVKRFCVSIDFLNLMVDRYMQSEHKRVLRQSHVKVRFD